MTIEQGGDEMQTYFRPDTPRTTTTSTLALYTGDGMRASGAEVDFHANRLLVEAAQQHAAPRREGMRQALGHAIIAIGNAIHGLEPEPPARRALDAR